MAPTPRPGRSFPWTKLWRLRLHRLTGRSRSCRCADAWVRRRVAGLRGTAGLQPRGTAGLVSGTAATAAAAELEATGIHQGYRLGASAVAAIRDFALVTPCTHAGGNGERFLLGDLRDGRTPAGTPVALADVDLSRPDPAIEALALDPLLLETAARYLGYPTTSVAPRLLWSPAVCLSDDERRRDAQTIDYHYDIERSRTLYAFFYLTPTDSGSGAHVVLPGTHRQKPMALVLGSTFQSAERLRALYPQIRPLVIEGGAGFGFVEDPACFHRALPPRTADRLCLQLRYA